MRNRYLLLMILLCCLGADDAGQRPTGKPREREWRDILGSSLTGPDCKPVIGENDLGLIDDAKRTAAMIQDPDAKRTAEDHIRMRSRRPNQ